MFKRVQKRQRKQEKEEELGLDSEMKEVLGLQDTDSEESDSSSDEGSSSGSEDEDVPEGSGDDEEGQEEMSAEDEEASEPSDEENEFPPMSVTEAVSDPLYFVSLDPETRACILCPGKLLKNSRMADVHKSSKAHSRRFTNFVELVSNAGPDGDVRDLIRVLNKKSHPEPIKATEDGVSKRAEKRKAKLAALKAKREKHKQIVARKRKQAEKAKASKDTTEPSSKPSVDGPPKKKRKVAQTDGATVPPKDDLESTTAHAPSSPTPSETKAQGKPNSKSTKAKGAEKPLPSAEAKPSSNDVTTDVKPHRSKRSKTSGGTRE